jgi:hypothetical protein
MPSVAAREVAITRLMAALGTLTGITVERNRRSQPDAEEAPVMVVYDSGHNASADSAGLASYEMQVLIEAVVSGPDDASLGPALNDLYARTLAALLADTTLGGAVTDISETSFDVRVATVDDSAAPLAFSTLTMTLSFFTDYGNPFAT